MATIISVSLILHFVVAGIAIEFLPRFFTSKVMALVFLYFFITHAGFGYVLRVAPWLVDPR